MTERKKFNLSLPVELMQEFDSIASRFGEKRKYLAFGAAVLMLIESSHEAQDLYAAQIGSTELPGGSIVNLVARAKSGDLRREMSGDLVSSVLSLSVADRNKFARSLGEALQSKPKELDAFIDSLSKSDAVLRAAASGKGKQN